MFGRSIRRFLVPALAAFFVIFSSLGDRPANSSEVASDQNSVSEVISSTSPSYTKVIQPLFDNRCIACHGCLGSPCNLKLSSFRGLDRGGFGKNPYSIHFENYLRTGMDVVDSTAEWRERGFYPVVSRGGSAEQNLSSSLLYGLLDAGQKHNQPGFSRQSLMSAYKKRYEHSCPSTPEALESNLKETPAGGMPYGLPALEDEEFQALKKWVAAGAPGPAPGDLAAASKLRAPEIVARWEAFFNSPDPRSRLVSRYIFDHVYLATLALDESPTEVFRLVRSKTAGNSPEQAAQGLPTPPVEIIDTPHPYDNPMTYAGVEEFFYRLKKVVTRPVQKSHFVWQLGASDIKHLQELFLEPKWEEKADLDAPWGVGNPFLMYQAIPTKSRYLFLIENSAVIVGGITSGPVCLGQTATYAVKDQFWVYFVDPDHDVSVLEPMLGLENWEALMDRSPTGNDAYLKAYGQALERFFPEGRSIDAIWDGDRKNPNAWLTILRHENNTWVLTGRQGGIPRSQWLMGYSGFERIYYDTVAHFKYWGSDVGKLETVGFFNFLRQEFEDGFLLLLPEESRKKIRERWSQGLGAIGLYLSPFPGKDLPSSIQNPDPDHPLVGIVQKIEQRLGPEISGPPDLLNPWVKSDYPLEDGIVTYDDWVAAVSTLTVTTRYKFPRYMPSMILVRLNHGDESRLYTLVVNRVYETQYTILFQNGEALPDLYTLSVYPTVVGGFPNLFMELDLSQAPAFIEQLRNVESLSDFLIFRDRYAILRNQFNFWSMYDWFNEWNFKNRKQDAGVFDLSYYDLYDSVY